MINPLYITSQVSKNVGSNGTDPKDSDKSSMFSPVFNDDYENIIKEIKKFEGTSEAKLLEYVSSFERSVKSGNIEDAVAAISGIYKNKTLLVKTLLETAMKLIPASKSIVTNKVFNVADINMNAREVVEAVKVMCQAKKGNYRYVPSPKTGESISKMIKSAGTKCNNDYKKLSLCDKEYWSYPIYLLTSAKDDAGKKIKDVTITSSEEILEEKLKSL